MDPIRIGKKKYFSRIDKLERWNKLLEKRSHTHNTSFIYSDILFSDFLINKFINFAMRDGKKYLVYKHFELAIRFIKKEYNLHALDLIRCVLYRHEQFFDYRVKTFRRNKEIYVPRLLEGYSKFLKPLRRIVGELNVTKLLYPELCDCFYKQIAYTFLRIYKNPDIIDSYNKKVAKVVSMDSSHFNLGFQKGLRFVNSRFYTRYNWSRRRFYGGSDSRNHLVFKPVELKLKKRIRY